MHFGFGAFTRAHQSIYTEGADAATGADWGIVAVERRQTDLTRAVTAQDGLYSVTTLGREERRTRAVGSVLGALDMLADADALTSLVAGPNISVITTTITEKGYYRAAETGALNVADSQIAADLAATRVGFGNTTTVIGRLAELLAARCRRSGAPLSIVSCDNMACNGLVLEQVIGDFIDHSGWTDSAAVRAWLGESVTFPQTIVDRIVPAPTPEVRAHAAAVLGVDDALAVAGEEYRQWVLEDHFAADRPRWETDGAVLVSDVAPYQLMKLRMLNGSHSALAYAGLAVGLTTVAQAMATPWGESLVRTLCAEVAPTVPTTTIPANEYAAALVDRFENAAVQHRLSQIGTDGSLKIPERWLEPLRTLRLAGSPTPALTLALATWVNATRPAQRPVGPNVQRYGTTDPNAPALATAWSGRASGRATTDIVRKLLCIVGAADLADDGTLVATIADQATAVAAGSIEL